MSNLYQQGNTAAAQQFNDIFYNIFVCVNGVFEPPYDSSTLTYVDWQSPVFVINDQVQSDANSNLLSADQKSIIAVFIAAALTYDQAVANGWLSNSNPVGN